MSFFKKFTPAGSAPIAQQKRVIKTAPAPCSKKSTPEPSSDPRLPRRVASSSNLQPSRRLAPPTANVPMSGTSSPLKRKKLDAARSTPNLKRSVPEKQTSLKPPTPESLAGSSARGRSAASSRSPRSQRLESSDEESEDELSSKRLKKASSPGALIDSARKVVHPISFRNKDPKTGQPLQRCEFIDGEKIASVDLPGWSKRKEWKNKEKQALSVHLFYPGIPQPERFQLVQNFDPDELDPVAEIFATMEKVADCLCPPALAEEINGGDASGGIVFRIRRSLKNGDATKFEDQLRQYNNLVRQSRRDGTFKRRIGSMTSLPFPLVEHILQQAYARTVALEVEGLKDYQAFSSEVYGELLPKFTSKIFKEAGLTSDKVFVDLGSGTGNVVLHAALEIGCESWGCEKMSKPAELAERQRKEFIARCRMWGINHGAVHLEHDTFLENRNIAEVLKRADVLLVNNFAFEPDLNQKLLDIFLDLKEGAQIFSLKPFVPQNHVITTRNAENPVNRLRMVEREYFSREVSWTDSGGKYYVHTVDETMLREFMKREEKVRRGRGH